ncbi:site-specific integrase [Embleya sp. NPDC055664]
MEDLYPQDKRGRITAKGGATEWIHWQSGTAQLLPRLIARRTRSPLFLTDRKAPAGTPTLDVCPETGRARPHDAEDGTSTSMLLARSRHASVRSLERYARPGVDAVARHVAERDPAARRRT